MTDVADLWKRIEEARTRLGAADETQIKRIEDLSEQVKEVRGGLARRYRELEQHREEVSSLRHENEQLRRMLHRLLLAIEQRFDGRLRDLVKHLEGEVSALVPMATEPVTLEPVTLEPGPAVPPALEKRPAAPAFLGGSARAARSRGALPAPSSTNGGAPAPSESDSKWLHQIMERARELTESDAPAAKSSAPKRAVPGAAA